MRAYILATAILFAASAIYVFWDAYLEVTNRTMIPEFNRIWFEFGLAVGIGGLGTGRIFAGPVQS